MVFAASGRRSSWSDTTPAGSRPAGSPFSQRPESVRANTRTLLPSAARPGTIPATDSSKPERSRTISGAPSTQVPWSLNCAALHLRAEENGTRATRVHSGGSGSPTANACIVELGEGSAPTIALSGSVIGTSPTASIPASRIPGSVSVPVLSMHSTSTRASPSIAASSWTSTLRRARRSAPSANASEVSRTRPSGTMAPIPATQDRSDSSSDCPDRSNWLVMSSRPAGTIAQVTIFKIVFVPCCSSERTRLNIRASP